MLSFLILIAPILFGFIFAPHIMCAIGVIIAIICVAKFLWHHKIILAILLVFAAVWIYVTFYLFSKI